MDRNCNVCGGAAGFVRRGAREDANCLECGANERARLMWLVLEKSGQLRPGKRVLHMAPEPQLHPRLRAILGDGYEPVDVDPAGYADVSGIRKLDLVTDAAMLPSRTYDLILHSHVMEHVPCNIWAVLWHLHRALKDDGRQVCCIPFIRSGYYEEDLSPLDEASRAERFGQSDHVRRFGGRGIKRTLGMVFRLPDPYDLRTMFDEATLIRHAIPQAAWFGWTPHTVLNLGKGDLLLRDEAC